MRRCLIAFASLLALAAPLAGCSSKEKVVTRGETEGSYLDLDQLKYQVQISRQLNPRDEEDRYYLRGISDADSALAPGESWFAVFMRVENGNERAIAASSPDDFEISDTQDTVYHPVAIDSQVNNYSYAGGLMPAKTEIPRVDAPGFVNSSVAGALVLFKVKNGSYDNRPLELVIKGTTLPQKEVTVKLDV